MHRINSAYPTVSQWWIRAWRAILRRRTRIIAELEEQNALAVRRRVVKNGVKKLVEVTQPSSITNMNWGLLSDFAELHKDNCVYAG